MFWVHSKYEPVTPPALARMSGITVTPRSREDLVGVRRGRVVGRLDHDLGLDLRSALSSVSSSPRAAGTSTSHGELEQLLVRDHVVARRRGRRTSAAPTMRDQLGDVEARRRGTMPADARRTRRRPWRPRSAAPGPPTSRRCRSPGSTTGRPTRSMPVLARRTPRGRRRTPRPVAASRPGCAAEVERLAGDDGRACSRAWPRRRP